MHPRRLLIVSHVCPFPPRSGVQVRIAQTLEWLKREGFEVIYVLQPTSVDSSKEGIARLRSSVQHLIVVSQTGAVQNLSRWLRAGVGKALRIVAPPLYERLRSKPEPTAPGQVSKYADIEGLCWPETVEATRRALETYQPKFLLSEYGTFSKCLAMARPGMVRLIDVLELYSINHDQWESAGVRGGFLCTTENERNALGRADVLIAIQRNDQRILNGWFPDKRVILMPCTCDVGTGPSNEKRSAKNVVLYVGSSNRFNVHGLRELLERVWPRVLEACPTAHLHVVGSVPQPDGELPSNVQLLGRVSDEALAAEYESAAAVLNPQVAGTGLKIKCVEALGRGSALVTYAAGADGLEDGAGEAFLLAATPEEFASHVVSVLRDPALRARLQAGALAYARRNFSPEAAFRELGRVLAGV